MLLNTLFRLLLNVTYTAMLFVTAALVCQVALAIAVANGTLEGSLAALRHGTDQLGTWILTLGGAGFVVLMAAGGTPYTIGGSTIMVFDQDNSLSKTASEIDALIARRHSPLRVFLRVALRPMIAGSIFLASLILTTALVRALCESTVQPGRFPIGLVGSIAGLVTGLLLFSMITWIRKDLLRQRTRAAESAGL